MQILLVFYTNWTGAVFGTGFRYFYRLPNFMKSFACDNICSWYKNCEIVKVVSFSDQSTCSLMTCEINPKIKNQCLSAFFPWQHVPLSDQFTSTVLAFYSICNRFWQLNFETGSVGCYQYNITLCGSLSNKALAFIQDFLCGEIFICRALWKS